MLGSEKKDFRFKSESSGIRLDLFLQSKFKKLSREELKEIIHNGSVLLNGKPVFKPGCKLKETDEIAVSLSGSDDRAVEPRNIEFKIIYEDDDIAVINKPAGLMVHPLSRKDKTTLVNGLVFKYESLSDLSGPFKPGIVHRLDKDTSGALIAAKNNAAHLKLASEFKNRRVVKKYLAVVEGRIEYDEGIISKPIGRDKFKRMNMRIDDAEGKPAETYYRVIERLSFKQNSKIRPYSFLLLYPKTGRTHQLRVHMRHFGHPIVSDLRYGRNSDLISRQALHSYYLKLQHPVNGQVMSFKAELPEDFKNLLFNLGLQDYNLILDNYTSEV
ncbi:MAG: RluA family pseudouridine synthase [Candidatus Omnitrophica bacterium]|nr:RluA family pseudouridine synthase [Candidatus Omnitrophota bacterium]